MKKITLILALIATIQIYAQSTCATALPIDFTANNTVTAYGSEIAVTCLANAVNGNAAGSAWFTYTPNTNGLLNVSSDLAVNGGNDTRVNLYTGTCGNLICVDGDDDVQFPPNRTTDATFNVDMGVTYYIAWDNRWSNTVPFDFTASFFAGTSPPSPPTTPSPADMATNVALDATNNNSVTLSWEQGTTGSPTVDYNVFFGIEPNMLTNITTTVNTNTVVSNNLSGTTYYWQVVAVNSFGNSINNPIWSFTTEAASVTPPTNAITPTPADGATMVFLDPTDTDMNNIPDNAVAISWAQDPNGQQPTAYTVRIGDSPTTLQTLTTTFTGTSERFINRTAGETVFWQIVPTNNGTEALNQPVWSFTIENTASINDQIENLFTLSPNPADEVLNIQIQNTIKNAVIYNTLGQVMSENIETTGNQINISTLNTGFYLLKIDTDNGSQTVQFIKS